MGFSNTPRADVRPEDFTPEGLRGHAEVLDGIAAGLALEAEKFKGEDMVTLVCLSEDCLRFAAVFRGLADPPVVRLRERLRLLNDVIVEHHNANIIRDEFTVCPVCVKHGGPDFFYATRDLLREPT
jgi:hypothetical protein